MRWLYPLLALLGLGVLLGLAHWIYHPGCVQQHGGVRMVARALGSVLLWTAIIGLVIWLFSNRGRPR